MLVYQRVERSFVATCTLIHKDPQVKKGHSSASQAGSVAHWMRRCVSDASALAEPSFGRSNPPRSDLFNFFVSQAFASCGHCPIRKPTHFRGTSQSIAGRPRRPLVKLGMRSMYPALLKLGYCQIPRFINVYHFRQTSGSSLIAEGLKCTGNTFSPPNCC